jgi:chemotaxis protein histidine kinase CheA
MRRPCHYPQKPTIRTGSYASASYVGPTSVLVSAGVVAAAGVALQMLLWQVGVMRMEAHLAELDRPEQERIARAKADEEKRQQDQKRQQAELQQQAERQRLEAEKKKRELAQERERRRLENEKLKIAEEQARLEEEKKAREKLEAQQAEQKIRDDKAAAERKLQEEKEAALAAEVRKQEAARKKDLEAQGRPYYPSPTTLYEAKNAAEWYQFTKDATKYSQMAVGIKALEALNDEGEPFLLKLLEGATTSKEYNLYLRTLKSKFIHFNDLPKLIPHLDKKQFVANQLFVLRLLSERAEAKPLLAQIDFKVSDLQSDAEHKAEVKQ